MTEEDLPILHNPMLDSYWNDFVVRYVSPKIDKMWEVRGPLPIYPTDALFRNKLIMMGIDQSTSCTGVCIAEYTPDKRLVPIFFIDVINATYGLRDVYCKLFSEWLDFNIPLINPQFIVYESVKQNASDPNAKTWLQRMASVIKQRSKQLSVIEDDIMPAIWRKHLLKDKCYTGRKGTRAEAKASSKEEVIKRFPNVKTYMEGKVHSGIGKSFDSVDSVDAYGIINGYIQECFIDGDLTRPRVTSMMRDTPRRKFNWSYSTSFADYQQEHIDSQRPVGLYALNSTFSLEENYRKLINKYPKAILYGYPTDEKMLQKMRIHANNPTATQLVVRLYNGEEDF